MDRLTPEAQVIAHRGASAHAPENTFAAFDLALAQGADVLEFDVRPTSDGELVLAHDPDLLRTTGDPRRLDALTFAALADVAADARPPSLDAVFARYGHGTRYLIDLKEPEPAWEHRVVDAITRHGLQQRTTVQSFEPEALRRLSEATPWLRVSPLYRDDLAKRVDLDDIASYACGIGPWRGSVDAALLRAARVRGLEVRTWTVDDAAEIEWLLWLGVDGVITNRPELADVLRRRPLPLAA